MAEEKEIDVFQMYIEELEKVDPCTPEEEEKLQIGRASCRERV